MLHDWLRRSRISEPERFSLHFDTPHLWAIFAPFFFHFPFFLGDEQGAFPFLLSLSRERGIPVCQKHGKAVVVVNRGFGPLSGFSLYISSKYVTVVRT